jgi:replication fork clamp-binding protein CrfC
MPTKEWLEQHTKVQAYLDADLSAKLTAWMKEKNISQLSQAVVAILEHYLNDRPPSEISSQVLFDELEAVKKEVALIKASLIEAGSKSLAPKMTSEVVIFPTERMEIQYTEKEAQDGLTKSELCDRLGLTIYQAEKASKEQEMSGNDYLFKVTGWKASSGKRPRYYPIKN